jgi:hypothetical protein
MEEITMSTALVRISDLRREEGDETVKELAGFLEGRLKGKVEVASEEITLSYEEGEKSLSKSHLRVLLRKFLHQADLKEWFRVISGGEDILVIKPRKT